MTGAAPAVRLVDEAWGDSAVLFTAHGGTADERWRAALDLHRRLLRHRLAEIEDWVHAFESVLIVFDCTVTTMASVVSTARLILAEQANMDSAAQANHFDVPVLFGGSHGPDLASAAAEAGMQPIELIEYLTSGDIVIGTLGGNLVPLMQRPGQPFTVSRMPSPRTLVPAGSLGLAGDRTCLYAVDAPGGWRLVGRTPLRLIDGRSEQLAPYAAGDSVRLHAIEGREWEALAGSLLTIGTP